MQRLDFAPQLFVVIRLMLNPQLLVLTQSLDPY